MSSRAPFADPRRPFERQSPAALFRQLTGEAGGQPAPRRPGGRGGRRRRDGTKVAVRLDCGLRGTIGEDATRNEDARPAAAEELVRRFREGAAVRARVRRVFRQAPRSRDGGGGREPTNQGDKVVRGAVHPAGGPGGAAAAAAAGGCDRRRWPRAACWREAARARAEAEERARGGGQRQRALLDAARLGEGGPRCPGLDRAPRLSEHYDPPRRWRTGRASRCSSTSSGRRRGARTT
jgi:hypothetical protein